MTVFDEALAERPGDGELLNGKCWHMAMWNTAIDQAEAVCTDAVKAKEYTSDVLDSRALAYYRLGKTEAALADLDAA